MTRGLFILSGVLMAAAFAHAETVALQDGRQVDGAVTGIDGEHVVVQSAAGGQKFATADVAAITCPGRAEGDAMGRKGQHVLFGEDGTRLCVRDEAIHDGRLGAATGLSDKPVEVPLDAAAGLLRPRADETPSDLERQMATLKLTRGEKDVLVTSNEPGQWIVIQGVLNGIDGGRLQVNYDGADAVLEGHAVPIVQLAKIGDGKAAAKPAAALLLTDGSRVAFTTAMVDGNTWKIASPALGSVQVDAARIAGVRFAGGGQVQLSDRPVADVRQAGCFDDVFAYRKDRSASGGPLCVGGRSYEKGLGLHARCELSFELAGKYRSLAMTAGIDDAVRAGAAVLRVEGDGKELAPPLLLDRAKPPAAVRVNVAGVKRLTVIADFSDGGFGAGARVDLCDAVLGE